MKSNPDLWKRLEAFHIDAEGVVFPFSKRLARDNQWSHEFALKAIQEYKRFVYLAMVSGVEVTPSDEVDQVWHLHLTYTRNYWGAFTALLGKPLHHGPTAGGVVEKNRYNSNYDETLRAYQAEFALAPPADVWPAPAQRFSRAPYMKRLCAEDYLLIPKRKLFRAVAKLAGALGAASVFIATALAANGVSGGISLRVVIGLGALILISAIILALMTASGRSRKGAKGSGVAGSGCSSGGGKSSDGSADGGDGGSGCSGCGGCGG